jgi:hypothetical protein
MAFLQVLVGIATLPPATYLLGTPAIGIFLMAVICLVTSFATLKAHSIEC